MTVDVSPGRPLPDTDRDRSHSRPSRGRPALETDRQAPFRIDSAFSRTSHSTEIAKIAINRQLRREGPFIPMK
jgi:hypothetical protein